MEVNTTNEKGLREGEVCIPLYDTLDFHIATVYSGAVSIWKKTKYVPHPAWNDTPDERALRGRIYKLVIRLNWRQMDKLHHELENWINLNTPANQGEFLERMGAAKKSAY